MATVAIFRALDEQGEEVLNALDATLRELDTRVLTERSGRTRAYRPLGLETTLDVERVVETIDAEWRDHVERVR
jgi:hypothetical protein